VAPGMML